MGRTEHVSSQRVGISKLAHPLNVGRHCREVRFVIVVLVPQKQIASLKSAVEVSRTFGTLFSDIEFHHDLLKAKNEEQMHEILLAERQKLTSNKPSATMVTYPSLNIMERLRKHPYTDTLTMDIWLPFFGLVKDLQNRVPYYKSDWEDGFANKTETTKVISAIFFAFTACLLPSIAFGHTNAENTSNWLNVERTLYAQMIGGLIFSLFSVQPLMLVLTTAPISLYIYIISQIADKLDFDFQQLYVAVGLWNAVFLILFAILNLSKILKWSKRSCEEIFAVFTAWAFINDALKHIDKTWDSFYVNNTYLHVRKKNLCGRIIF